VRAEHYTTSSHTAKAKADASQTSGARQPQSEDPSSLEFVELACRDLANSGAMAILCETAHFQDDFCPRPQVEYQNRIHVLNCPNLAEERVEG